MFKLSLKNIWSRKGRLILTSLAVIAGTAFLSGVFVFTDTIKGSFDRLFATAYENTDAYVRSSNVIEGQFGEENRDRIPADLVDVVRGVPGVAEAYGDVGGTATMSFNDEVIGTDGPPKFGAAWIDSASSPWSLAEGNAPVGPTEVVIDATSAAKAGVELGATLSITALGEAQDFTVVGIARFAGGDSTGGATFALFDLATAQQFVIGDTTKLDSIVVVGAEGLTQAALADSIDAAISDTSVEVLTGAEIIEETQSAIEESLSFLTLFLSIFAMISLFVGSFIIYNVFSISAAQRQRENALLRAVGASRAQVTRSMFVEAIAVGLIGSVLGCLGGVGLATAILAFMNEAGFGPGDTDLALKAAGFIITILVGVFVTMICAVVPAIRSGRVPPLAAMRDVAVDHADTSKGRRIAGSITLALGVGSVALGIVGEPIWLAPGVVGLFVSLVLLGPFVAGPISRGATPLLGRLRGASGTMAGRNAARNPKSTALTAGALAVGLSLVIGVASLGSSAKATVHSVISEAFQADYIVTPSQQSSPLPSTLAADITATGQGQAVGLALGLTKLEDNGTFDDYLTLAVDPVAAAGVLEMGFTAGGFEGLNPDAVVVAHSKADDEGWTMGSTLRLQLLDGTVRELTVAGLFDEDSFGNIIVDRAMFEGQTFPVFDVTVLVRGNDGITDATTAAIKAVTDKYPTAKMQTREEYIADQAKQIDTFLTFIYALLGMSIFIAAIGIAITLFLAVWERRRELGLLRAVGTTKRQVRSSVLWESLIIGVVGVVMGVLLGVGLGWIIVAALKDEGLTEYSVPTGTILVAAIGAILLASAAALWPARRAAKADILEAIATT